MTGTRNLAFPPLSFRREGRGERSIKGGERVEVRREKKPLPGMLFLLASGTKKILTRQEISTVYRLASTRFYLTADS